MQRGQTYGVRARPAQPQPQLTPAAQRVIQGGGYGRRGTKESAITDDARSQSSDANVAMTFDLPSLKVSGIASEIAKLEARCNWLEERNAWLTERLMKGQRKFIEKTVLSGAKGKMRRCFEGWRDAMKELRLERQLDEQTRSLDQCQGVAKELGTALTHEQQLRVIAETERKHLQQECEQVLDEEPGLQANSQRIQRDIEMLEKHIREAENCLVRSAAEAQHVIDTAKSYESRCREISHEDKHPYNDKEDLVEWSKNLREEAHGVMRGVRPLLGNRQSSPDSP